MKLNQIILENNEWNFEGEGDMGSPDLVICFGERKLLNEDGYKSLLKRFPEATVIAGSTAGEINNQEITDHTIVATAVKFDKATVNCVKTNIEEHRSSFEAGSRLVRELDKDGLRFVFIISDGQLVNGSDLVAGITDELGDIPVAGGLAGDGADFNQTLVALNDDIAHGNIVAVGFYGESLKLGYGSKGGWDQFGPTRTVTKSEKNVLMEIDGKNALELYKSYLGPHADKLPGSALFFPLSMQLEGEESEVVRTILSIDDENGTMTFAGNIPEGASVRLMKANLDNLVDAAEDAASDSRASITEDENKLAILISCVGRKLIFGNRVEEEFDAAKDVLGEKAIVTGFYSYGEISPFANFQKCQLHNQTMTVTTIAEAA